MDYPTRKEYRIDIKGSWWDYNVTIATISFMQPYAYDIIDDMGIHSDPKRFWKRLLNFIKENITVHTPSRDRKRRIPGFLRRLKMRIERSKRETESITIVNWNIEAIGKKVSECYFKRWESIFRWLEYPKIKWDNNRSRKTTFVESLIMLCGWDCSKIDRFLKTHTFEQIDVLLDGKQLLNNEKLKEFHSVNDMAVMKITDSSGKTESDKISDTFAEIRKKMGKDKK